MTTRVVRVMFTRPTARDDLGPRADTESEALAELLADPHCRYLLAFLWRTDRPAAVDTAARHIAGELTGADPASVPENVKRRVGTWLHHGQLPALATHGLVDFDPDGRTVELADDAVVPLLLEAVHGGRDESAEGSP